MTPIRVPFSNAAATLSLSASCLLTSSAVLCVPSLIRTSTRNRGGRDCSSRTRTPNPMTVARLQWVMVGVIRTVTVRSGDSGAFGRVGLIAISGSDTTASAPREIGCSGSEMVDTRSMQTLLAHGIEGDWRDAAYRRFLVHRSVLPGDRLPCLTLRTNTTGERGRECPPVSEGFPRRVRSPRACGMGRRVAVSEDQRH